MREFLERYDVLAAPVTQVPAFDVELEYPEEIAGVRMGSYLEYFRSCSRITVTVAPGDRRPGRVHARTGCRSGCSSSAGRADEAGLLRLARAFCEATGLAARTPEL